MIEIRPARPDDAQDMAEVQNAIYRAGLRSKPIDVAFVRERYLDSRHRVACTVAEQDGRVVGFQSLTRSWPGNPYGVAEGWGIIGTHVRPDSGRSGLGRRLFASSLAAARAAGLKHIDATIGVDNAAGLSYYAALVSCRTATQATPSRTASTSEKSLPGDSGLSRRPTSPTMVRVDHPVPDAGLVVQLLRDQFPRLAGHEVRPSAASGSSNHVFRVGDSWAVRLPRSDEYAGDLRKEADHLPRIAPHLPVPVPDVYFLAEASELFPRPWTVVSWVPGDTPQQLSPAQQAKLAAGLGRFVERLHGVDTVGLEPGAGRWGYRAGEPVTEEMDRWAVTVAVALRDLFDPGQVTEAWRRLRDVPPASGPPCWVHTDLALENVLVAPDGELTGVVDFGGLGIGDSSVDLLYAWSMFDAPAREILRTESRADDATWLRARAWTFVGPGLMTIESYRTSMPVRTARLTTMVEAVAAEVGVDLGRR